ncbi:uncharacterized protein LOC114244801 [Bombyx mandarina]|uniref:Uncharacterized protein LOC114244801 n=1 Tax=Bombyx mandarina TaxID=7092 RepID=A0A6J2JRU7_BOMMA|nr:uncharacterized protein LOC114244801 [Bombyx mandarina]
MYNLPKLNINVVIELSQQLFENSRCAICDNSGGLHMRYPCGHSACEKCTSTSVCCLFCSTPPGTGKHFVNDPVLTKRVKNATDLFNKCQEIFNVDVYRRKRLSDQLKVEKELFPECIQAPLKYYNKNKSYSRSVKNKENNLSFLPGEDISLLRNTKMNDSVNYVQLWLQKNEQNLKRKPFSNINYNNDLRVLGESKIVKNINCENENKNRKRYKKTTHNLSKNQVFVKTLKKSDESVKNPKRTKRDLICDSHLSMNKNDNDESGIVVDDELIVIDDTQTSVDKDVEALLAVIEANRNNHNSQLTGNHCNKDDLAITKTQSLLDDYHVPFYKRSKLIETCSFCNKEAFRENERLRNSHTITNNVSVTIENKSFTAIIKIDTNQNNIKSNIHSTVVQTDISDIHNTNELLNKDIEILSKEPRSRDRNLKVSDKTDEKEIEKRKTLELLEFNTEKVQNRPERPVGIIIEESDSESDVGGAMLEVVADIHRPNEDPYAVLTEIEDFEDHSKRFRREPRGFTPNSSNSSEKENFNPNRQRREKIKKKKIKK